LPYLLAMISSMSANGDGGAHERRGVARILGTVEANAQQGARAAGSIESRR
jgi:hypothetical protein